MLISLLITCVILGLIWYLLSLLPIAEPFRTVVNVIFIVIAILFLLSFVPGVPYHHTWGY